MRILYATSEAVPFAKTGGLADVAGALPKAIHELDHDIRVIMPKYRGITGKKIKTFEVNMPQGLEEAEIYEDHLPGSSAMVYFVGNQKYFDREGLYQNNGIDYPDNCERFSFFCKAVMEAVPQLDFLPDVIHCNDWQSGLAAAYVKKLHKWNGVAVVYTIHNMDYLGLFPKEQIFATGFDWRMFTPDRLEFFDRLSLAKGGLVFADVINTVSPTYAREIQTPEFGAGLDGLMRKRSGDIFGILNGVDYKIWNPRTDKKIAKRYSAESLEDKSGNKLALQKLCGLPAGKTKPVIGIISRLADQKGFDILAGAMDAIINMGAQIVILGVGEPKYHRWLQQMQKTYPKSLSVNLEFNAMLAELIYAGADMFLMPSRYEPCGLGQLISFKYGTIPVVRKTGGLADTVHDGVDGFVFTDPNPSALVEAAARALAGFKKKKSWHAMQELVMDYDYSWKVSAKKYVDLYKGALLKIGRRVN
ncbi:MAG: glycogen synthase GlgA [Candidatus Margulisiibacteriota bacterium]